MDAMQLSLDEIRRKCCDKDAQLDQFQELEASSSQHCSLLLDRFIVCPADVGLGHLSLC